MTFTIAPDELRGLVREVVDEVLGAIDWPAGRVALTEPEAAAAIGRARHVLRDARMRGELAGSRAGKCWVYQRSDLIAWLNRERQREGQR